MNHNEHKQWVEETIRRNTGASLQVGAAVVDADNNHGIVVRIVPGVSVEDHGVVAVWQSDRVGYGDDNCEHYTEINWREWLRLC